MLFAQQTFALPSCSVVFANTSDTDDDHYTFSRTYSANTLQIAFLINTKAASPDPVSAIIDSTGPTWTIGPSVVNAGSTRRLTVAYTYVTSGSTGNFRYQFGVGNTQTKGIYILAECTGTDTTVAGAVVQTKTDTCPSSCTAPSITLTSAVSAGNSTIGGLTQSINNAIAPGGSETELGESGSATAPAYRGQAQWLQTGNQTMTWSVTSGSQEMIMLEIGSPSSGVPVLSYYIQKLISLLLWAF